MITRKEVLSKAALDCLKDIYSVAQPSVTWEEFMEENREYKEREKEWEKLPTGEVDYRDYVGPAPYEFYYLPKEVLDDIYYSYVHAYKIDSKQNLLDIIETLKSYCEAPIVDKFVPGYTDESGNEHPGYKDYDHPDNLQKVVASKIEEIWHIHDEEINLEDAEEIKNIFFKFLDMAGDFYNWNADLNSFAMTVYLGPSPNSNKEKVIENWKKYRNKDIEIDESKYNEDDE